MTYEVVYWDSQERLRTVRVDVGETPVKGPLETFLALRITNSETVRRNRSYSVKRIKSITITKE